MSATELPPRFESQPNERLLGAGSWMQDNYRPYDPQPKEPGLWWFDYLDGQVTRSLLR